MFSCLVIAVVQSSPLFPHSIPRLNKITKLSTVCTGHSSGLTVLYSPHLATNDFQTIYYAHGSEKSYCMKMLYKHLCPTKIWQ